MHRAWPLRSAWAWRCPQRKAKRSLGGVAPLGTAIGVGGEEARDGGLILALDLNLGVIAGGAQAAASIANGGSGAGRTAAYPRFAGDAGAVRAATAPFAVEGVFQWRAALRPRCLWQERQGIRLRHTWPPLAN